MAQHIPTPTHNATQTFELGAYVIVNGDVVVHLLVPSISVQFGDDNFVAECDTH